MSGIKVFLTVLISTLTSNISFIQLSSFNCLQCFRDIRRLVLKLMITDPWDECNFHTALPQHLLSTTTFMAWAQPVHYGRAATFHVVVNVTIQLQSSAVCRLSCTNQAIRLPEDPLGRLESTTISQMVDLASGSVKSFSPRGFEKRRCGLAMTSWSSTFSW